MCLTRAAQGCLGAWVPVCLHVMLLRCSGFKWCMCVVVVVMLLLLLRGAG